MKPATVLKLSVAAAVLWFAVQGGEYGTTDLLDQGARERLLRHDVDSLQALVDSLVRRKKAVQTDASLQERIAREEFGMVRGDRELLYRFDEGADGARAPVERDAP